MNLAELVSPRHTAVLTMEMQQAVVGREALMPALADAADACGLRDTVGRVCAAARGAGSRVVHCTVETRPDGAGFRANCKIFGLSARLRLEQGSTPTDIGQPGTALVPELGVDPRDIVVPRMHGMTPFTSTSLDQILRNLGVTTVVATGVSVNLGIIGLCLGALDLGYQVVLVRDAVIGVPTDYADAVIANSLSYISTVVTSYELISAWPTDEQAAAR